MAFDREGALKKAEKLLKQGRIDGAIEEYLRIVEAQPRDWNSANALGDLYVRAGQIEKGVAQYTLIADHFATEGFYPKASALYKKILKVKPGEEHTLLQLGDLAARQGLLGDAKGHFQAVAEARRGRGDRKGAAAIAIRIGTLDPDDLEARLGAARMALDAGDRATALRELRDVAIELDNGGKAAEALGVFRQVFELAPDDLAVRNRLLRGSLAAGDFAAARQVATSAADLKQVAAALEAAGESAQALEVLTAVADADPEDLEVRAGLAQAFARSGDLERARRFLTPETAGHSAPLWMTLAEIELRSGRLDEGRAAVTQALTLDLSQREAAVALGCRLAEVSADAAYVAIEAVADAALEEGDFAAAAAALHELVTRVGDHIVALMRLVEVCVDGGLEATMYSAQAQLADAYLGAGRGLEARIISEDLVAREPWDRANIERFRRALVMLGETDPDAVIADRLSGDSPFMVTDKLDLNEGLDLNDGTEFAAASPSRGQAAPADPGETAEVSLDLDLSEAADAVELVVDLDAPAAEAPVPRSLDQVFRSFRDESGRDSAEEAAAEQYRLALTYRDMGMVDDAIESLQAAARSPRQRFDAASLLGHLLLERGESEAAVEWLERAAEAPAPTQDAGRALLYDLAETLEKVGESARALAVFVELEADSPGYRDVTGRIDRLSKVQARG
ncbi:MAG: tetratricopeptide repeat protein [Vicinamibacterales bacterium]|nr:tetratricopeptide repeat protein [Vicinamibacterales bacterium]